MLDVWQALGGDPHAFHGWIAHPNRYPSDAWAQLLAAIRGDRAALEADSNPPAGELLTLVRKIQPGHQATNQQEKP